MDELMKWDVHLASSMWHALMHYVLLLLFQGTGKSGLFAGCISGTATERHIDSNVKITSYTTSVIYTLLSYSYPGSLYIIHMCRMLLILTTFDLHDNVLGLSIASALHKILFTSDCICSTEEGALQSISISFDQMWFQHERMKRLEMSSSMRGMLCSPLYLYNLEISLRVILYETSAS